MLMGIRHDHIQRAEALDKGAACLSEVQGTISFGSVQFILTPRSVLLSQYMYTYTYILCMGIGASEMYRNT